MPNLTDEQIQRIVNDTLLEAEERTADIKLKQRLAAIDLQETNLYAEAARVYSASITGQNVTDADFNEALAQFERDKDTALAYGEIRRDAAKADYTNAIAEAQTIRKVEPPATEQATNNTSEALPSFTAPPTVIENPLHKYPSYTYSLSLHLLSPAQYSEIVETQTYTPTNVLIASAGRHGADFVRNSNFNEDYFFDGLTIETVIGLNETSRATNAISIKFKIIEPYGVSLIDRIIFANKDARQPNYLASPYLLQIDFFAIDATGNIVDDLKGHTKRIPIKLVKMHLKAGNQGSEYEIEAVPFNHSAYDSTTVSSPTNFEITASTVEDFFGKGVITELVNENERATNSLTGSGRAGEDSAVNRSRQAPNKQALYKARSYSSAINSWYANLKETNKIESADEYYFKFHGDTLSKAKFSDVANNNVDTKNAPITLRSAVVEAALDGAGALTNGGPVTRRIFTVSAGTSIDAILNYIILHSSYIQDQIVVPEEFGNTPEAYLEALKERDNKNTPLMWFKIVPTITLTDYDAIRQVYSRKITYHVIPYTVTNAKLSVAPQGVATDPVKEYNYLYTGLNTDIIDFNLSFEALYYTAASAFRERAARKENAQSMQGAVKNPSNFSKVDLARQNANLIAPSGQKVSVSQNQASPTSLESAPKGVAASDLMGSLYTNSAGDMISVNLKIIGDPTFIKQDDMFYTPDWLTDRLSYAISDKDKEVVGDELDIRLTPNNSIITDTGEVYVQVTVNSKIDINEKTGLMSSPDKTNNIGGSSSLFSGMYRVLTVTSEFRDGKFTQDLVLIRAHRQQQLTQDALVDRTSTTKTEEAASGIVVDVDSQPDLSSGQTTDPVDAGANAKPLLTDDAKSKKQEALEAALENSGGAITHSTILTTVPTRRTNINRI